MRGRVARAARQMRSPGLKSCFLAMPATQPREQTLVQETELLTPRTPFNKKTHCLLSGRAFNLAENRRDATCRCSQRATSKRQQRQPVI